MTDDTAHLTGDRIIRLDFFGSYSEVPEKYWISKERALPILLEFIESGAVVPDPKRFIREC